MTNQMPSVAVLLGRVDAYLTAMHSTGRHDHIGADYGCEGCALLADIRAHIPVPSAPADRAALRDLAADALADAEGWQWAPGYDKAQSPTYQHYLRQADAVLAVLPPPADRPALLREVADICDEAGAVYTSKALNDQAFGAFALMERFLRKADEAEYVATPCSVGGCEPGGEPCTTHERLMAHAEGDHELCEPDCGTSPSRMAGEAQQSETQAFVCKCPAVLPATTDRADVLREPVNPCTRGNNFCGQHGYDCPPDEPAAGPPAGGAPHTKEA